MSDKAWRHVFSHCGKPVEVLSEKPNQAQQGDNVKCDCGATGIVWVDPDFQIVEIGWDSDVKGDK